MSDPTTRALIALALAEDIGPGDVTSRIVPADLVGSATIVAKSDSILAGTEVFREVMQTVDARTEVSFAHHDGETIGKGTVCGNVRGPARSLLSGERTALNFLQRLSGIATFARLAVAAAGGTRAQIVDTRKTTPGLRSLEKAAVRAGGGKSHRFGLFDGVLIKDNHVAAVGGVRAAIEAARRETHHLLRIECEVTTLDQLDEAIAAGAEVVLLDNMTTAMMAEAVKRASGRVVLEASGNMTLERIPEVAKTGVDLISLGALTHTVRAADLSLEWES